MPKSLRVFCFSFLATAFLVASAAAQTASWRQVVGIILAGNPIGSGSSTIPGGFLPWTATAGSAHVNLQTGEVRFFVRGLVFAAGMQGITIGTPGPITAVKGVLVCDVDGSASGGNSVLVQTPTVPLSSTGDAQFSGNIGPVPSVCSSEPDLAFLVRVSSSSGDGPWIANGAVLSIKGNNGQHDGDR